VIHRRRFLALTAGLAGGAALALPGRPALAQLTTKFAEELQNGEYNWFPERSPTGPVLIIVSIPDQICHVYRNGIRIAASTCSTGKKGHATPTGVFTILQKDKHHRSSTYNNAPMPNMNRLTWSGIALHAGQLPGYPASHGCVRLPLAFSDMLFGITKLGMTVVIADDTSYPVSVAHPGMVLGQYARNEFKAVDTALMKQAYAEGHEDKPKATAIVVSSKTKTARVLQNGKEIGQGAVDIKDPGKPIGNGVYTLAETDAEAGQLKWLTTAYSGGSDNILAAPETIQRIAVDPALLEKARQNLQMGMALVTTDEADTAKTRTASDFVVLRGQDRAQG
jgi:hypothetical protein